MVSTIIFSCSDDGENGIEFDDLVQYGAISVNLEGTRPDGVPFTDTAVFQFLPTDVFDINGDDGDGTFNLVTSEINGEDVIHEFGFGRFLGTPDNFFQGTTAEIFLEVTNLDAGNIGDFFLEVNRYSVIGEDNKFFAFEDFFAHDGPGVTNFKLSDLVFNDDTNRLSFTFSFDVDADNNSTDHDLKVSGSVDITIFEEIEV